MNYEAYNEMTKFLDENVGNGRRIVMRDLDGLINRSRFNIYDICKGIANESPHQIIAKKEVEKAYYFYTVKKYTVKEIAKRIGFAETSGFCRFFKKQTGTNLKAFTPIEDTKNNTE